MASAQNKNPLRISFRIGKEEWFADLKDNAASRALLERLPLEISFLDLYGRELCHRFPRALPTENVRYKGYEVGDIVYWAPRRSFVIMYAQNGEKFDMQDIGRMAGSFDGLVRAAGQKVLITRAK